MTKNEKSTFSSTSGSMFHIFLESELIEMIKHIQKNENLKDESEVIIHLIQDYIKKNITQLDHLEHEIFQTTYDGTRYPSSMASFAYKNKPIEFDGNVQFQKLEKILASIESENLIKKLPQHEIYGLSGAAMIHRFHTKILPVKFSLMCLSRMIIETDNPWISLTELKRYTLHSAKIFIKKFNSSPIRNKFKANTGFPIQEPDESKSSEDSYLSYARSSKRFLEQFVGRKLQKHEGVQIGGACFEMGLIEAKTTFDDKDVTLTDVINNSGAIYVTLSESGKEFLSYKNHLIDFVYRNNPDEPSSIFSDEETKFYFQKILPKFKFENNFVEYLMKHERIEHTRDIKNWFEKQYHNFCDLEFPNVNNHLQENNVRIYSNTIMNLLMKFGVFTKDPKSKSGPYTRMKNLSDLR